MKREALISLALVAAAPAAAEMPDATTGNGLLELCSDEGQSFRIGICYGFIEGVIRRDDLSRWTKDGTSYLCDMARVTNGQKIEIVVRYLKEHPEKRHYHGAGLVAVALKEAFCTAP